MFYVVIHFCLWLDLIVTVDPTFKKHQSKLVLHTSFDLSIDLPLLNNLTMLYVISYFTFVLGPFILFLLLYAVSSHTGGPSVGAHQLKYCIINKSRNGS